MSGNTNMIGRALNPLSGHIYAMLRIVVGLLIAVHGMQKILGILGGHQPEVMSQLWIGGAIELVGGLSVALGVFTRWAAFLLSGTMAVAYIQFHWKLHLDERFFPAVNRGELALVYCFVFLYIASRGAGRWAIDKRS